ncbi:hypothetical protein [Bacillus albus]|uniref:hypothetical protein n=1 Tax=Bacillus albus TaxID=2026189 RepID=UPI00101EB9A3|nr:hypothetical protein [Bacillus albus]
MAKYYGYCYNEEGRFTEIIPLEYETNEETGEETPLLPPMCTLEQPPDGIYYPIWTGSKWKKTVEAPPNPPEPPTPSDVERLQGQIDLLNKAIGELIIGGALNG